MKKFHRKEKLLSNRKQQLYSKNKKMINVVKLILAVAIAGSLLVSCNSNKARLSHKWFIKYASYVQNPMPDLQDTTQQNLVMGFENAFKGNVYDIKDDGTFSSTAGNTTFKGTWTEADGVVKFKYDGSKKAVEEDWEFPATSGIKIYHDSTLDPKLMLGGGAYLQLTIKPAPGEKVTPDY
jgi:hypothetical protein